MLDMVLEECLGWHISNCQESPVSRPFEIAWKADAKTFPSDFVVVDSRIYLFLNGQLVERKSGSRTAVFWQPDISTMIVGQAVCISFAQFKCFQQ